MLNLVLIWSSIVVTVLVLTVAKEGHVPCSPLLATWIICATIDCYARCRIQFDAVARTLNAPPTQRGLYDLTEL